MSTLCKYCKEPIRWESYTRPYDGKVVWVPYDRVLHEVKLNPKYDNVIYKYACHFNTCPDSKYWREL